MFHFQIYLFVAIGCICNIRVLHGQTHAAAGGADWEPYDNVDVSLEDHVENPIETSRRFEEQQFEKKHLQQISEKHLRFNAKLAAVLASQEAMSAKIQNIETRSLLTKLPA